MRTMWTFTVKNKIKVAMLFFSVLCLVMLTNIQEQRLVKRINESVTSLYSDRLVVGDYIHKLSNRMDKLLILLSTANFSPKEVHSELKKIDQLNTLYEKTVLTDKENINFNKFKIYIQQITQNFNATDHAQAIEISKYARQTLETLSSIQVEEGKVKLDEVLSMTSTSRLMSYIEIVILIVIAVLIQILVFSAKVDMGAKVPKDHRLN
ncbi:MCP four helix bundle domain-containing protein [Sphingobacterium sp. PCS056]|uniref:MCP four helix bundle domain-containing protein n=1 Tax=Sphingobacterium sp. PCS056 TaxID=2931400 RepID=UPI00200BE69A|nr:MCP four helix bundle domain-containing protein [Sphingobacterium sp. PCS056]UPZ35580.1 MCP four helix bundle domain-containing protein [Sphingobacterium sp. PCS056]